MPSAPFRTPIPVVEGWELVTPSADELRMLLPLPSTAFYQGQPFDPDHYGELAMLRRVNRDAKPQGGLAVPSDFLESLDVGHPERQLWQPLIALSLYDHPLALKLYDHPVALSLDGNPILRVWAWYRIEPRRRTDRLFESVPRTSDGETDIEQLLTGAFYLDATPMLCFLEELSPLLTAALSPQAENKAEKKAKEKAADQLRRCAQHFLTASDAHRAGKVSPQQNADAVLHYAIALEVLLGDDDHSDLTRKVSQRAAVLAGANDDHRLTIEQLVRDAYSARSVYAHGGKLDKIVKVDLAKLRRVVCRCILTRLILGDPTRLILGDPTRAVRLHELADRALLSHDELQSQIRHPFEEFVQRYRARFDAHETFESTS
jgi:hypothetical protein